MAFDINGDYLPITGYIRAGDLEVDAQVLMGNDPIKVFGVLTERDTVIIDGFSVLREKPCVFFLNVDKEVPLWTR